MGFPVSFRRVEMTRKIVVLLLIILAAYIMLPFGFGLWNENIGVRGQISFAESPSPSQELLPKDENSALTDSTDSDLSTAPESVQDEDAQEVTEQETATTDCPESSVFTKPDDSNYDESGSPEAIKPVEASAEAENPGLVQPEAETDCDG